MNETNGRQYRQLNLCAENGVSVNARRQRKKTFANLDYNLKDI